MRKAAVVLLLAAACSKSEQKTESKSEPSASNAGGVISIGAGDLAKAYRDDRAKADAQYRGKRVRVSGAIRASRPDAIVLGAESGEGSVECAFTPDFASRAAMLKPGVRLSLECDCDGFTTVVALSKCNFGAPTGDGGGTISSMDVCKKLEAAGVAKSCEPAKGTDSTRFVIASQPGSSGLVVGLSDATTYSKYVAGVDAQRPDSPLKPYRGSPSARIVVHLTTGVTQDAEEKMKAVVDAL
jgi:hypothetical protein